MPFRALCLLLLLPGCLDAGDTEAVVGDGEGAVTISGAGAEEFGTVGSAVWYRDVSEEVVLDRIVLTTEAGGCEKVRTLHAAQQAFYAITYEGNPDWCADAADEALAFGAAQAALMPVGSRLLNINLADDTASGSVWGEGTWTEQDDAFFAFAYYVEADILDGYAAWDEAGTYEDGCGGVHPYGGGMEFGFAQQAALDVSVVTSDRTSGTLDGELVGFGDEPVAVAATFDAAWCEVE